jgi:hypothetical protein
MSSPFSATTAFTVPAPGAETADAGSVIGSADRGRPPRLALPNSYNGVSGAEDYQN